MYRWLWNAVLLFTLEGISFWKIFRRSRNGRRARRKQQQQQQSRWWWRRRRGLQRAHTHFVVDFILWFAIRALVHRLLHFMFGVCLFRCLLSKRKCSFYDIFGSATFADDDDDLDTNRLATAPRMGTSLRTAATAQSNQPLSSARPRTSTGRPLTGMVNVRMPNSNKPDKKIK